MARSTREAEILALKICAEQFGLISSAQLRACGLTRQAIHRRVQSGRLFRVNASVVKSVSSPDHELSSVMAAVLSVGDGAVISHTTAAALRGLDGFRYEPVHISVTHRRAPRPGVILHTVDGSLDHQKTMVGSIPTTTAVRTLVDLASTSHPRLEKALDEMIRKGMVVVADMWELIESPEMWRRKGTRILADLMRSRTQDRAPTHSEMEDLFKRIVRKHRLPMPSPQYAVKLSEGNIHLDFAYPHALLGIECDSYAWHMDRAAFDRDRARDNELQSLGWIVLRFTWPMLKWRDSYVADQVSHHLALRTQLKV